MSKDYPKGYKVIELATTVSLDRNTLAKILNEQPPKPVNHKSLDTLFSNLGIDLEDSDYEEYRHYQPSPRQKKSQTTSQESLLILDDPVKKENLKQALLELDYIKQETAFTEFICDIESAVFLIHGQPGYGQRWLANRLTYKVPYFTDAFQRSLCLKRYRNDINNLWQNLADMVGSSSFDPQAIADAIYKHRQTQTVMLCLQDVDWVRGKYLQELLDKLWQPLVKMTQDKSPEYPLLLFLIDNKGCKSQLGIPVVSQPDSKHCCSPIELAELQSFDTRELRRWITTKKSLFAPHLDATMEFKDIIGDIIERNNNPSEALEAICTWCHLDWFNDIERGLKLWSPNRWSIRVI